VELQICTGQNRQPGEGVYKAIVGFPDSKSTVRHWVRKTV